MYLSAHHLDPEEASETMSHLVLVFPRTHDALDVLTDLGDLRRSLQAHIAVRFESGRATYITRTEKPAGRPDIGCLRDVIPVGGSAIVVGSDHRSCLANLEGRSFELHEIGAV